MQAIHMTAYGSPDVLKLVEVKKPVPKDNEVLVKVHASTVNVGDLWVREFNKFNPRTFSMPGPLWYIARLSIGLRKPNNPIPGSEFAGEIAAVGKDVTHFKVDDPVFGYRGQTMGAHAEYVCIAADGLIAPMPNNMSMVEAATIPYGALTALSLLRRMNIQPGQKVLINGASGGIGSGAVQIAKSYGAEVTGVCGTPRVEFVKALGADHVIDYTKEDFTQNGQQYDLILDVIRKSSFDKVKNSLTEQGVYLLASFKLRQLFQMLRTARGNGKKVMCLLSDETSEDMMTIKAMIENGDLKTVIDRCYPLEQVADAHRYIESGQKSGQVVITVAQGEETRSPITSISSSGIVF